MVNLVKSKPSTKKRLTLRHNCILINWTLRSLICRITGRNTKFGEAAVEIKTMGKLSFCFQSTTEKNSTELADVKWKRKKENEHSGGKEDHFFDIFDCLSRVVHMRNAYSANVKFILKSFRHPSFIYSII